LVAILAFLEESVVRATHPRFTYEARIGWAGVPTSPGCTLSCGPPVIGYPTACECYSDGSIVCDTCHGGCYGGNDGGGGGGVPAGMPQSPERIVRLDTAKS
jgi:hypothetical protein